MCACVIVLIINVSLAIGFMHRSVWVLKDSVISKYLLVIFGINMGLYVVYYILMKYYYVIVFKKEQESLTWICWIYFCLSLTFTVWGHSFFKDMERDSRISPAKSRGLNQECTFWFFDKHDLWHFTSSAGLFFTFMTVLTMEDNNTDQPWDDIPVF